MPTAKPRLVLLIGDEGARLVVSTSSGSSDAENARTLFAATHDEPGEKEILDLVARYGKSSRPTLLLDTLAQDYRVENLPRVNPLDRAKLIRNRLRQSFPEATAAAALKLDSSRVGLASWHTDSATSRWLDKLSPYAPRVALLPLESASLAASLAPGNDWALLLSLQRTGGLRQIVTHKGNPVFARLTHAPANLSPEAIAATAAQDLKTTLGYVNRLGLADSRDLHVVALLPETSRHAFEQAGLALRNLTLLPQDEPYGDAFLARNFAQRNILRLDTTPRNWKQSHRDRAMQTLGKKVSRFALLLALLSLGLQTVALAQALIHERQEIALRNEARQRLDKERAESAAATEPLGRLRAAVERKRVFAEPTPAPWPALDALSQAFSPDMRLAELEWQAPSPPAEPVKRAETLRLTLRLPATENREQWRARVQEYERIVAEALPDYARAVTRNPFPTTPQEPLTGGNEYRETAPTAEIVLTRKEPPS